MADNKTLTTQNATPATAQTAPEEKAAPVVAPAPAPAPAPEQAAAAEPKPRARRTGTKAAPKKAPAVRKAPAEKTAAAPKVRKPRAKPAVLEGENISLTSPSLYTNREISWIEFDRKVLETAMDKDVPLLDRLKFLAIFFNNLDEFYMVRVMNLQRQSRSGVAPTGADRMPPAKQLQEIRRRVGEMLEVAEDLWNKDLKPALEQKGVRIVSYETLSAKHKKLLDEYFESEILPVLTPQAVDAGRPFPMISSRSINFMIELESSNPNDTKPHYARLKNPSNVGRFLFVPEDVKEGGRINFNSGEGLIVMMEDLVAHRMGSLFPGYKVKNYGLFRVTRNTDGEIEEDEADDLLAAVRDFVDQRRFGSVVRLEMSRGMPVALQDFLTDHLELQPQQVVRMKMPLGFSEFMRLMGIDKPQLKYPPFKAKLPHEFDPEEDIFKHVRARDIMVYHPYNSFGSVLNFIKQAAMDPNVVAIKQTLYRCGSDSPIVKSLLEARRRGKQVTAVVELKARFDEEANITWAEALERAGVNVVYGFAGLKIHAKLCLVVRREPTGMKRYAHIGTGNYNASSAKIYTDLGLFTANDDICYDVQNLFNVMTGFGIVDDYRQIFVSPVHLRKNVTRLIREEAALHRKSGNGHIVMKCNQLVDADIIRELYEASRAGVKIECIVRGICALRPGIPGVSENITVRSIVGELLEHARIYWFNHDGDNKMYVGSADMMSRNLNGRIEVLTPVLEKAHRENIFKQIVTPQLTDNTNAWVLNSDGSYTRLAPKAGEKRYTSQSEIAKLLNLQKD